MSAAIVRKVSPITNYYLTSNYNYILKERYIDIGGEGLWVQETKRIYSQYCPL